MEKILVADDEKEIRNLLRLYLENGGYTVCEAENGEAALKMMENDPDIHLCLLDIMMPEMDGYQVLRTLRRTSRIPVIIISAKDSDPEKILGLDTGADDYIVKPFNPLEVLARVRSNLRRYHEIYAVAESAEHTVLRNADLALDTDACCLYKNGRQIELTKVEYRIMEMLMENPGKVFTRQQIYERGWGEEFIVGDNNIMVCISKLRAKLDEDPSAYIKTIRGLGYRLEKQKWKN